MQDLRNVFLAMFETEYQNTDATKDTRCTAKLLFAKMKYNMDSVLSFVHNFSDVAYTH